MPAAHSPPITGQRNGLMVHGGVHPSTSTTVFRIVSERTRSRAGGGQLESDRPADIVDDEVEPIDVERVDGRRAKTPEASPAVVESPRAFREPEARKVPGDSAQPSRGELPEHFPVAERRAQHPVNAHDRLAVAFGAHEALYAAGGEGLPGRAVGVKDASCRSR